MDSSKIAFLAYNWWFYRKLMGLILKMLLVNYKFRETQSYFQRYLGNSKSIPHISSEVKLISGLTLKKALDKSKGREWEREWERVWEGVWERDWERESERVCVREGPLSCACNERWLLLSSMNGNERRPMNGARGCIPRNERKCRFRSLQWRAADPGMQNPVATHINSDNVIEYLVSKYHWGSVEGGSGWGCGDGMFF